MTAIEKAKEALSDCADLYVLADGIQSFEDFEGGQPNIGTLKNLQEIKRSAIKAREALAALEAEKPAEDGLSDDDIDMIANLSGVSSGERAGFIFGIRFYDKTLLPVKRQQYAEAYHKRKPKETEETKCER